MHYYISLFTVAGNDAHDSYHVLLKLRFTSFSPRCPAPSLFQTDTMRLRDVIENT